MTRKFRCAVACSDLETGVFTLWNRGANGVYVLGFKPSNALLASRIQLRERDELPFFEVGKTRVFELE